MNITVVGTGYVGLVTAACLAELGNNLFCLDVDARKIDLLNAGQIPIYEPHLGDMIERNRAAGRMVFSTDVVAGVLHGSVQFIAVGTPSDANGRADLQYVFSAARAIGQHMHQFTVVVDKSTVPVGTGQHVAQAITGQLALRDFGADAPPGFTVVSNPEFLKEGAAIHDFMRPERIILGSDATAAGQQAREILGLLYAPLTRNHQRILHMDIRSAEFTKYAANAMLATRISFMNELANLADKVGVDIEQVRQGIGSDPRIGYDFLYAGTGYGGSCFPKDTRALVHAAASCGASMRVVEAVEQVNAAQKQALVATVRRVFGEQLAGRRFAVWGLAFKPNTDDMREAPSRKVMGALVDMGAQVVAFDPVAQHTAQAALADDLGPAVFAPGGAVQLAADPMDALDGVDALLLLTEWKCFQNPDFHSMGRRMRRKVVFDGRNVFDPAVMQEHGFAYVGIGRRNASGLALLNGELAHWLADGAHHHLTPEAREHAIANMVAI